MKLSNGTWRNSTAFCVLLIGMTLAGCSHRESLPATGENVATNEQLPFSAASDKGGIFPTGSLAPTAIPAGTPVTIHLQLSLSSATSHSGDSFDAVLDQPIIVRGREVAPRGAILTGKILDAKASDQLQEPGYMRLALTAISINGKSFPIQTSSIFMKRSGHGKISPTVIGSDPVKTAPIDSELAGGLSGNRKGALIGASAKTVTLSGPIYAENRDVGVNPERRLTFRLAQPLPLEF